MTTNRIRALREERARLIPAEYSQAALARRLGIAADTLRAWELGRARPRKASAKRLAKALGVTVDDLGLDAHVTKDTTATTPKPRQGVGTG